MKTCDKCIYYSPSKTMKNIGTCQVPVPYWVTIEFDSFAFVAAGNKGVAPLCKTYTEEQVDVEELLEKNKELEKKLYYAKVQESLMRPIINDNFKG